MATPYFASVVGRAPNGETKIYSYTVSDVAGEFFLLPSGASEIPLSGNSDIFIVDVIVSSAAGTTKNVGFFIGGADTGVNMNLYNLVGTIVTRPFQNAPIRVPKGQAFKIKQLA